MATGGDKKPGRPTTGSKDRLWIPRFWSGMMPSAWFPLLARNRFAVTPSRIVMALILCLLSFFNFALWVIQQFFFGRKIARTQVRQAPIFIIGHWRAGTTLLHELLILDRRHTYPDTFECFAPNHFLASAIVLKPCLALLLPSRRPMDNMAAGWNHPQEDEFALCNMGVPSPYLSLTFPNHPPQNQKYLDLEGLSPHELSRWKERFLWFLRCLTVRNPGRIILKSPPHTCRIRVLLEMFPDARFVHIVRDPYVVFPSTIHLWKRLARDQGLQVPQNNGLEEGVFQTFNRMYAAFERDRHLIRPGRFCEVRYEQLVRDPVEQVRAIYDQLELGGFDDVRPALDAYAAKHKDYQTNRYDISPTLRSEIARRWAPFIEQYGYA